MRERRFRFRDAGITIVYALACASILAGCNLLGPRPVYDIAEVTVSISSGGPSALVAGVPSRAIGETTSPDSIDRVELSVAGNDRFGNFQDPLATLSLTGSGASWTGTVPALPLGPTLVFTVIAYDETGSVIYTGSTTTALSALQLTVALVLEPYDDEFTVVGFPVIRQITRPAEIVEGTGASVDIDLEGSTDETLIVELTSGGGSFAPVSPVAVPLSGGAATLALTYSAPDDAPATYTHSVRAENEQGNSVSRQFTTTVVWETADAGVTIGGIAPAVTGFDLSLNSDGGLVINATVTDDGPADDISFDWSYDGGLVFADATANPATLSGYHEAATGTVTLVVTDSDTSVEATGLSTTVSFLLQAGLFPDEVEAEPVFTMEAIVFTYEPFTSHEIWLMDVDGSNKRRIYSDPDYFGGVAWSPDRSKIVFANQDASVFELYTMNSDGSAVHRLGVSSAVWPDWSPDGTKVLYSVYQGLSMRILDLGSGAITSPAIPQYTFGGRWSPDGSQIVFRVSDTTYLQDVYVSNPDGSDLVPITMDSNYNEWPDWSPDGSQIAYVTRGTGIILANADGSNPTLVVSESAFPGIALDLDWSSDGAYILFTATSYPVSDIYRFTVATGELLNLTSDLSGRARAARL